MLEQRLTDAADGVKEGTDRSRPAAGHGHCRRSPHQGAVAGRRRFTAVAGTTDRRRNSRRRPRVPPHRCSFSCPTATNR